MENNKGMYVHPAALSVLVGVLAVLITMLAMNYPGGIGETAAPSGNATAMASAADDLVLYYSTMHPWIVQDHPGTCPICGMDLVKMPPDEQAKYLANHPELT